MKNFWVSWYWPKDLGGFELHSPWWISGYAITEDEDVPTVVAAVRAESEEDAMGKIVTAFDKKPKSLEWRFCEERSADWSPFCDRFPQAAWMNW